jgi:hypothetical protein
LKPGEKLFGESHFLHTFHYLRVMD